MLSDIQTNTWIHGVRTRSFPVLKKTAHTHTHIHTHTHTHSRSNHCALKCYIICFISLLRRRKMRVARWSRLICSKKAEGSGCATFITNIKGTLKPRRKKKKKHGRYNLVRLRIKRRRKITDNKMRTIWVESIKNTRKELYIISLRGRIKSMNKKKSHWPQSVF